MYNPHLWTFDKIGLCKNNYSAPQNENSDTTVGTIYAM